MALRSRMAKLVTGMFSLDQPASVKGFVFRCMAWIVVFRAILVFLAIVIPDSKGYASIVDVSISSIASGKPANDAYFYWIIASRGFLAPGYGWALVNFSPLFPAVLAVLVPFLHDLAPLFLNTVFLLITPFVLVKFLSKILKKEDLVKRVTIVVLFNPIFMAYSIFGLTEPLHFLLLFTALWAHYCRGTKYRLLEYSCIVLIVLNRFIGILLAGFYLFKALLKKGLRLKERIVLCIPVVIAGAMYFGWELACAILFGHTPSEARAEYWGHTFNFNPLSGDIILQLPIIAGGAVLGLLTLQSHFSIKMQANDPDEDMIDRAEIHAFLAYAAVTLIFLGLMNKQISIARYLGTLFPLFVIMAIARPSSSRLADFSAWIICGLVLSHEIAFPVIAATDASLKITNVDTFVFMIPVAAFLMAFVIFYRKRNAVVKHTPLIAIHLLLSCLVLPLSMFYP